MDSHTDLSHFDEMKRLDNLFGNLSESVKSKDEANQKIADQLEDLHKRSESELFDKHQRTFHPSDDIEVDISFADEPKPIPQPEPVAVEPELPEAEEFNVAEILTEVKNANEKIDALSIGLQAQIDNILDDADDIVYQTPEEVDSGITFSGTAIVAGRTITGLNSDPNKPWVKVDVSDGTAVEADGPPSSPFPPSEEWYEKAYTAGHIHVTRL